ncbi:transcription initiation factor TFIID subunit 8-like [Wolffia australiana]
MNDGGKENARDAENGRGRSTGDVFGRAIARVAVAQICESLGFFSVQHSALDALSDVAIRYVCDLGQTSRFYSNLAGRTHSNVFDVLQGLEELGSSQGFSGASDVHHCLVNSGIVRDLAQYVEIADEAPFARSIPRFPVAHKCKIPASFAQSGEQAVGKHIPDWLPVFPDPHTYVHTPVWDERAADPKTAKIEQARQRRRAEKSLLSLQQRLALSGAASVAPESDNAGGIGRKDSMGNPFFAPPLLFGEREVSLIVPAEAAAPADKVSVLETFAPTIEAMEMGVSDSLEMPSGSKILPGKRPAVCFKLGSRKFMAGSFNFRAHSPGKDGLRIIKDDERDDKKRRAELILKEAMENPHELAQL